MKKIWLWAKNWIIAVAAVGGALILILRLFNTRDEMTITEARAKTREYELDIAEDEEQRQAIKKDLSIAKRKEKDLAQKSKKLEEKIERKKDRIKKTEKMDAALDALNKSLSGN